MNTNKTIKSNVNYFKKNDTLKYAGIVLAALGLFLYFFGWSYISYIIATIVLPVGGVLFIIGSSGRASDSDIDEFIAKQTVGVEIDMENNPSIKKRLIKQLSAETAEGYEYYDGLMIRKAKDGSVRSSEYHKSVIYPLSDAIYVSTRKLSLVDEEKLDKTYEIAYADIKNVEIYREDKKVSFGKNTFKISVAHLVIRYGQDDELSLPIHDNASADSFVERLNRIIASENR